MVFKRQSMREWAREWRESDWRETIPLSSGRECPNCWATVCGGKAWRAHWAKHARDADRIKALQDQVAALSRAVRELAVQAGHADWYPAVDEPDEDGGEAAPPAGYILGQGELPPETRGGED